MNQGYKLDALDGFIVGPDQAPPPGTVRLCRKQYTQLVPAEQVGDHLFYIEPISTSPICDSSNDCSPPNGTCGIEATYSDPTGLPAFVGYVFPTENGNDNDNDSMHYDVEISEGRNSALKDNDIFDAVPQPEHYPYPRLFVHQQAQDFLRRRAQDHELQSRTVGDPPFTIYSLADEIKLRMKTNIAAIEEFTNHPENDWVYSPVIRLYWAFLNRFPDYEGLEYWTKQYRGGTPLDAIAQGFAFSEEFLNRPGGPMTDSQFVSYCYSLIGVQPSPQDFNDWVNHLATGAKTRGWVMTQFSNLSNYVTSTLNQVRVSKVYQSMLRRTPDSGGFNYHVNALNSGGSFPSTITGFFNSTEYRLRFLP